MSALPPSFVQSIKDQFDDELSEKLIATLEEQVPPVSIRINPLKFTGELPLNKIPWTKSGYYLKDRPVFTKDPLFHAGAYYVQEASSMILEAVFNQVRPEHESIRVLDLCAAPGGKSTHLLSLISDEDLLISNEVIQSRASILHENMAKWGSPNCIVTNSDPEAFGNLRGMFDLLLIDAPCSGEGMFRKDPEAINEWSPENVQLCYQRQQRIISDAWKSLAEGGVLIYSTCTFNQKENEEILEWLIKNHLVEPVRLDLSDMDGLHRYEVENFEGYKLLPGQVAGEGFSFFVVRKTDGFERWQPVRKRKKKKQTRISPEEKIPSGFINKDLHISEWDGKLIGSLFPTELEALRHDLKVIKSGILIGERKKNKVIPSHELALSNLLDQTKWPIIELTYKQSVCYLMKEPFELDADIKGFHLVTFKEVPLGWINHLGNRFNNLYPSNWRIQRDFRKEKEFSISLL